MICSFYCWVVCDALDITYHRTIFQSGCAMLHCHRQWEIQFFHILVSIWYCSYFIFILLFLYGWSSLNMVLICISLIPSEDEHLVCFFAVCILYDEMFLYVFCLFSNQIFFKCWVWSSLYIIDINYFTATWVANIYSQASECVFILLTGKEQTF